MIRRAWTIALMAAGLALPGSARADGVDRLHCDAIGVRKQEQLYQCLGRCERRNGWRVVRFGIDTDDKLAACRTDCQDRYDEAIDQLEQHDVCGAAAPQPDPSRCQARIQRIDAMRSTCKSQCSSHGGAPADGDADCAKACDAQCATAVERLMTKDFCIGYSANGECVAHPTDD
jgi:hypothetical protein